jgi:hypothetical protein
LHAHDTYILSLSLALSIPPLLEAPAESFFWNFPEFGHHIWFYFLHGCEMCPLEAYFQSWEQPKVTWSKNWRVWRLDDNRYVSLGKELLHNNWCVAKCIIVMQKPLSLSLPPNHIAQLLQNLHIQMSMNTVSRKYKLTVYQTVNIKKFYFRLPLLHWCITHIIMTYTSNKLNQWKL